MFISLKPSFYWHTAFSSSLVENFSRLFFEDYFLRISRRWILSLYIRYVGWGALLFFGSSWSAFFVCIIWSYINRHWSVLYTEETQFFSKSCSCKVFFLWLRLRTQWQSRAHLIWRYFLSFLNVQCVGWWSAGDWDWEQDDGVDSIVVCKIGCKIKQK